MPVRYIFGIQQKWAPYPGFQTKIYSGRGRIGGGLEELMAISAHKLGGGIGTNVTKKKLL
jgi:hypothetical protein